MKTTLLGGMCLVLTLFVPSVHAGIVYSGPNRDVTPIAGNFDIDVAGDSAAWDDFNGYVVSIADPSMTMTDIYTRSAGQHYVESAVEAPSNNLARLSENAPVDASLAYQIGANRYVSYGYMEPGPELILGEFYNVTGFVGLRLSDGTNTYYGWMRVTTENCDSGDGTITIHDWAYNDTPGAAILAGAIPEPGTMAILALGCVGMLTRRRNVRG